MSESHVPEGWAPKPVSELADTFAGGTPNRMRQNLFGGEIPWVKSTEVNLRRIDNTDEKLTDRGLSSSAAKWVRSETPLVALYGATAGVVGWLGIPATTNQAVLAVEPVNGIHSRWLYWALTNSTRQILASVQGSGQPNLSKAIVDRAKVLTPTDPEEQRRIAEILDTADEAIQKTEALIAKLKQMKAGLLHDLLTRGIDENGELRPASESKFDKDEGVATANSTWISFEDLVENATLGTTKRGLRSSSRIPLLKMGNLGWGTISAEEVEMIDLALVSTAPELILQDGDFLFNTRNTPDLVGKSAVWHDQLPKSTHDNNLLRVRFHENVNPDYVCFYMSTIGRQKLRRIVTGTTSVAAIYFSALKDYKVPLPNSREEQDEVVRRIAGLDRKITYEERFLAKLKKLKAGLMHDLLTGNKRVNVAEPVTA